MLLAEKKDYTDRRPTTAQCCATGVTPEGKTPKTLVEEMVPLLDDRNISNRDKIRVIALYILYRDGVPDEDRKRLYQHARLSLSEQEAVNNLVFLGAKVVKVRPDMLWTHDHQLVIMINFSSRSDTFRSHNETTHQAEKHVCRRGIRVVSIQTYH
jgi:hypothetical protein